MVRNALGFACIAGMLFVAAGCGGGGGSNFSTSDVESKVKDRAGLTVTCTETTTSGEDQQTFACTDKDSGDTIVVSEDKKGVLSAVVQEDGAVKDFFVLD